jgi:hypothetical protein
MKMAKFCENCGTKYEEGARFCSGCGAPLENKSGFIDLDDSPLPSHEQHMPAPAQNAPVTEPQYTSSAPPNAITLKSSAPIPSKIGWSKWGYIAGFLLIAAGGFGIIILIVVLMISIFQMSFHMDKMRRLKFKFVNNVSNDDIYNKLSPILTQKYGDKIEFDQEGDTLSVHYKSIIYDINLHEDSTFSIWWRKSITGAIFSFNGWKRYKKIRIGTAMVAYELQKAFHVCKL